MNKYRCTAVLKKARFVEDNFCCPRSGPMKPASLKMICNLSSVLSCLSNLTLIIYEVCAKFTSILMACAFFCKPILHNMNVCFLTPANIVLCVYLYVQLVNHKYKNRLNRNVTCWHAKYGYVYVHYMKLISSEQSGDIKEF